MENISVFDLVVTVLLATTVFWGGMRGVVSQISAIATWVLSGLAAARFGSVVGEIVSIPEPWRAPVSALIVFCASLLALNIATRFVKRAVSLAGLKEFDRQAGALFGLFKGCAICVVLTFFCVLTSEKTRNLVDESKSGPYLASVALLLKSAFPESETMARFEALVATMGTSKTKENAAPTLNSEIADLEEYLKSNVLSKEAADVVEEAASGAENPDGGASSRWTRFLSDLRSLGGATRTSEANGNGDANDDAGGWSWSADQNEENEGNASSWRDWSVWGEDANDDVRDGAVNDGYYDEYEKSVEYAEYADSVEVAGGDGEASNDWSDLATFLTNLTGGTRSTRDASAQRRTANYGASSSESLNDFLGAPPSANARNATPIFDAAAPRTTDGAILGRPNTASSPLIPPLPY